MTEQTQCPTCWSYFKATHRVIPTFGPEHTVPTWDRCTDPWHDEEETK